MGSPKCANKGCVPALRLQKPLYDLSVCLLCSTQGKGGIRLVGKVFFWYEEKHLNKHKTQSPFHLKAFWLYIFFTVPGIVCYVGYFILKNK